MSNKIIACLLGLSFFVIGVLTLPHYGINWDTINHLPRGQAYLHYFLTGKKDFSDLLPWKEYWQNPDSLLIKSDIPKSQVPVRSLYQSDGTTFSWFMEHDGDGHPPLSDIASSFFNLVFFQKLRLINDIDSYRIYGIFLAALLVGLIFYWVSGLYGKFAGLISSLSLSMYPLFWSESHFNTEKDIPEVVYWSFFIFCFWKGITKKNIKWIILSGVPLGLALGTKFNILFVPFVVIPWLITYLFMKREKLISKINFKLFISGIIAFLIAAIIFTGSWPYLWADPIARITGVLKFYKTIGLTQAVDPKFVGAFGFNTYGFKAIEYMTPLVILLFFVCGAFVSIKLIKKNRDLVPLLFLFWLLVPIVRVSLPHANIYGGIRQIMEYIPAMAIIAGIGAKSLGNWMAKYCGNKIAYLLILALFIPITLKLVEIHPNENVYFNMLIGGLKGAKAKNFPYWGNTFGAAYREGVSWIDKNAEQGAKVVLAYELLPNIPRIFFRNDIGYYNTSRSGYLQRGEYAITLSYQNTNDRSYYDSFLNNFVNPIYTSQVDGVDVVKVWKNDKSHLKMPLKERQIIGVKYKKQANGLLFDLGKKYNISRLEINYKDVSCSKLTSGVANISRDGTKWVTLPGELPGSWRISALGVQPSNGSFIEPFVGQEARYINLVLVPNDTCLKNILDYKVYYLVQDL